MLRPPSGHLGKACPHGGRFRPRADTDEAADEWPCRVCQRTEPAAIQASERRVASTRWSSRSRWAGLNGGQRAAKVQAMGSRAPSPPSAPLGTCRPAARTRTAWPHRKRAAAPDHRRVPGRARKGQCGRPQGRGRRGRPVNGYGEGPRIEPTCSDVMAPVRESSSKVGPLRRGSTMPKRPSRVTSSSTSGAGKPAAKTARVIRASCQATRCGMPVLNSFTT
jgi:hypothetical protein